MKLFPIFILCVFLFLLGFCLGGYHGIDAPSSLIPELISKNNYDIAMFVATFIAALGTSIATVFAFYLYFSWKAQQNEIELMAIRKELLKSLVLIEKVTTRLFYSYRVHSPKPKNKIGNENELAQLLAEFKTNLYLYYILKQQGKENVDLQKLMSPASDFFDSSKKLYELCSQINTASASGYLSSYKVDGSILQNVKLDIPLDFGGLSTHMKELKEILVGEQKVSNALRELLSSSVSDISKENSRNSI